MELQTSQPLFLFACVTSLTGSIIFFAICYFITREQSTGHVQVLKKRCFECMVRIF